MAGNVGRCRILLQKGPSDLIMMQDHKGQTCLHVAAAAAATAAAHKAEATSTCDAFWGVMTFLMKAGQATPEFIAARDVHGATALDIFDPTK